MADAAFPSRLRLVRDDDSLDGGSHLSKADGRIASKLAGSGRSNVLRVAPDPPARSATSRRQVTASRTVAQENRAAAGNLALDPKDPRWVFAMRAASQLDGSALPPERREKLMRVARLLGIRVFDANVIIAIVQDQARQGRPLTDAAPTVAMLNRPETAGEQDRQPWLRVIIAVTGAVVANAFLIWWLLAASGG